MLGLLYTTVTLRLQLPSGLLPRVLQLGARRSPRPMAVPMAAPNGSMSSAMAVPMHGTAPSRLMLLVAGAALLLATAGLWRQDRIVTIARIALDGLRDHQVAALYIDGADRPAMDPGLAWVLDPRARPLQPGTGRLRRVGVQPFEYEVRENETLQEIATRFGTEVSALLWNNGLDNPEQVQAGARLMILPVRGVLHLVKADETLASIAERYGSQMQDIITANALERLERLSPGQILVVAGGSVPMPAALTSPTDAITVPVAGADDIAVATVLAVAGRDAASVPVVESLPEPPGAAGWQRDFIMSIAPGARTSQRKSGVPASVTLAQAILESDWGRSKLTREANNLFGIKAYRNPGTAGIYEINTWEVLGGRNVTVFAAFKAYTTLADSIVDHGNWFHDNNRYHGALEVKDDPRAFAYAINAAGYATDPAYAPKLIQLMERYNLYAYDVKLPQ